MVNFNLNLENLMKNTTSFIYGEAPTTVPIYAVVSMCSNDKDFNFKNGKTNFIIIKNLIKFEKVLKVNSKF